MVDSKVFQRSVDYPEKLGAAYHVALDSGTVITVRVAQVVSNKEEVADTGS